MEEHSTSCEPLGPRTWIPCLSSTLVLFGMSTCLRYWVAYGRHIQDPLSSFRMSVPDFLMTFGSHLWIPILIASSWGFWLMRSRKRDAVLTWFLWMTIVLVLVHAYLIYLFYVHLHLNEYLPRRG